MNLQTKKARSITVKRNADLNHKLMSTCLSGGIFNKKSLDISKIKPESPYTKMQGSKSTRPRSASAFEINPFKKSRKTLATETSDNQGINNDVVHPRIFPKIHLIQNSPQNKPRIMLPLNMKISAFNKLQTKEMFDFKPKDIKLITRHGASSTRNFTNIQAPQFQTSSNSPFKNSYRVRWFDSALNFMALDKCLKLGNIIGEGAFAKVLEAEDLFTGETVAVKVFDKRLLTDTNARKTLQNEIDMLSRLIHPSIVKLRKVIEDHKSVCLILDHWGQFTLKAWLESRGWTAEVESAIRDVGKALAHMHSQGFYHRDIKLTNIMLKDGKGCLLDFGMAVESKSEKDYLYCGTPNYLSPEMVKRSGYLLGPNDVWAFAVTLFRAISGVYPFGGSPNYYSRLEGR